MSAKSVVLLSGGLDSAVALARAREDGYETYALTIGYGQRHAIEVICAADVARSLGARLHRTIALDLAQFGGSALLGRDTQVPKGEDPDDRTGIPSTYVPARNTVFLALALAWAESLDADAIYLGVNAIDYSGYPDCRPEYLAAFQTLATLATRRGIEGRPIRVCAPLQHATKMEIVREGVRLGVDFGLTSSCYDPGVLGQPCGQCDSCQLRARGFREAGVRDPRVGA